MKKKKKKRRLPKTLLDRLAFAAYCGKNRRSSTMEELYLPWTRLLPWERAIYRRIVRYVVLRAWLEPGHFESLHGISMRDRRK